MRRAYRPDTATLITTWSVDGGELELADGLVAEVEGRFLPGTVLVRRLTARGGRSAPSSTSLLGSAMTAAVQTQSPAERAHWCASTAISRLPSPRTAPTVEADRPIDFEVRPGRPVTIVAHRRRRTPLIIVPPPSAAAELARDECGWRAWAAGIEAHAIATPWCAA